MASFTIKVKRNTRHTRYNDPYIQQGLHGILNINFKHSHLVNDAEAWAWLKRSDETRKIFIQYFSYGMSPSAAIKHHESSLLHEDPDLLANGRRNPPKAWVYALHESWIKGKKNYMTSIESNRSLKRKKKKEETDGRSNLNIDAFEEISSSSEKQPASHQKLSAPCIIHMDRKLYDNCEDLKYLKIPNEVEDLFYKYFDDGLDVSEAMKLNKENIKKGKTSSPFNPSERLVMFIYKNWSQQRRLFDKANKNADNLLECDMTNFGPYIANSDSEDLQSSVQKFKSNVIVPQAHNISAIQENYSLKTISRCVPILPHPSPSKITIQNPLAVVKNVNFASQQLASESKPMFDLNVKLSNNNSSAPNMYYLSEPAKLQLIPLNSSYFQNPVISVINPFDSVSNSIQVSLASLPSVSFVDSLERGVPSVQANSLLSDKENTSGLPSLLKKPNNFSGLFNKSSKLSAPNCQSDVTDSCKEPEIPNDSESSNQKGSSLFRPNVLDEPNSCFKLNSHGDKSEIFHFDSLEDENSESTSSIDSRVKELIPVSQKSPTTSSLSSSSSLISHSHKMKANSPNCSGMDVWAESEVFNFIPTIMNVNSMNSIQHLSRNETLGIKTRKNECASQTVTSNENKDHQFLMSLLPEFESIPEEFKMQLKKEMHNLILLTKLASAENTERET